VWTAYYLFEIQRLLVRISRPENGWVFDPLDSDNFIEVLQLAWENRNKWEKMGKESLRIVADYTPEKVVDSIYYACNTILNKKI
jgi:glycosyltransferase involved in cell wall biosynthesis